jgi:hypothetical protein
MKLLLLRRIRVCLLRYARSDSSTYCQVRLRNPPVARLVAMPVCAASLRTFMFNPGYKGAQAIRWRWRRGCICCLGSLSFLSVELGSFSFANSGIGDMRCEVMGGQAGKFMRPLADHPGFRPVVVRHFRLATRLL